MRRSVAVRIAVLLVLLGAYVSLPVFYDTVRSTEPVLSGQQVLFANPQAFVGEEVVVSGSVVDEEPVRVRVTGPGDSTVTVTLVGGTCCPETGSLSHSYGVLVDERTVDVIRMIVVPWWGLFYTYAVSLVAGVWVLLLGMRTWSFDVSNLELVPRSAPRWAKQDTDSGLVDKTEEDSDA
ncbi:hypothetical protein N0B31_19840 [Salinirubellus salinus]|uniref:Uncharacterized protein n=1 Tax=Salinirubellus salinus TaxID=1364945 RepID=A0A9E7R2G5_9EURY|nr:hypothetical protein [Salinirubellus salinus]UWM54356.1 hypothetical protein N0B31_19840 [Salinirubellus salinus]